MKKPSYSTISKITFFGSISLIAIALISFFWTLIFKSKIDFDITSQGWSDFLTYYSPQIKIAGVGLALFAIWMTAERMKQTQDQIEAITDNNRFNNFFKHREEFIKYFSAKRYFKLLAESSKEPLENYLMLLYEHFFYKNYNEFTTSINNYSKNYCGRFFYELEKSELNLNRTRIMNVKRQKIIELSRLINLPSVFILKYINSILDKNREMIEIYKINSDSDETANILDILFIYISYLIISDIFMFSEENRTPEFLVEFYFNTKNYLDEINIDGVEFIY